MNPTPGVNGEHEVRLERIEQSLRDLHEKMDTVVETGVVNQADIVWLKWAVRLVFAGLLGVGGLTLPRVL